MSHLPRSDEPADPIEGQTFAAIDLGSNSFHMVVGRYEHGAVHVIDRLREMVRLAEGVRPDGGLDPVVEQRALDCLTRFGERVRQISQTRTVAVGTNALRRMKKSWKFLNEAETRLGVPIEIISGQEEARLIYLGVAHGISERGNQRLVIDIGGGSTEFVIGREFRPLRLESMYFGCVGIAQRFFEDGSISRDRWNRARTAVAVELQRITADFKALGWQEAIGSSGTLKAVRNTVLEQGWSQRGITPRSLENLRDSLLEIGHSDGIEFGAVSALRRPVFASGSVIAQVCLEELDIDRLIVADYALREGLLYDLIGRITHDDPRDGSVEGLLDKYHIDRMQAGRVRRDALDLHAQVREDWDLGPQSRDWLEWGSLLHEMGLTISHHGYHRHGAYLIENSDLPGFSKQEQMVIATLVQLHRRKPNPEGLDRLVDRIQTSVLRITALLRIAVLLNRTRLDRSRPDIQCVADRDRLTLRFPADWLAAHPLIQADLIEEQCHLTRLGFHLEFS